MKIKLDDMRQNIGADSISKKGAVITVREGFFYTHGRSEEGLIAKVKQAVPGAKIVDSGEVWKSFRGGATLAQQSHWFVKFELPVERVSEANQDLMPATAVSKRQDETP